MTTGATRRSIWWGVLLLAVVAGLLHLAAGYTLPRPWPDESHFLAPALRLAAEGSLGVPQLNAPEGIFWMPSGYYVLLAPFLKLGLDPLATARLISVLSLVVFAAALVSVATRVGLNRVVAVLGAAAWLAAPRVVAAGNIARMEAPVLALAGVALWLLSRDRWPAAVATAALAPLIHPIGFIVLGAVVLAGFMRAERGRIAGWEWWLIAVVSVVWVVQVGYFALHADVVAEHLRFQLQRKAGRALTLGLWAPVALVVLGLIAAVATRSWHRAPAPWVAAWSAVVLAGGFVVGELLGHEIWYGVLGRETAVALAVPALLGAQHPSSRFVSSARVGPLLAGLLLAGMLVWTLGFGWFRTGPDLASRQEWREFVGEAVVQLQALDEQRQEPATVLIDPLSGFGQELFAREWSSLRFVQPTPVTQRSTQGADFVMLTPGLPLRTTPWSRPWIGCEPVLRVRSTGGRFRLELHDRSASPSPSRAAPLPRCPSGEPARARP